MRWTAIVPLKGGSERKSRLSARLSPEARAALADHMFRRTLTRLHAVDAIDTVLVLSPHAPGAGVGWIEDRGRGLNAELQAARATIAGPLLVIHADLPLVGASDIARLLERAAAKGVGIAPDRHGAGTNALALATDAPFRFAFGDNSFARHRHGAGGDAAVVRRWRLALDVDMPEDLDAARARGFRF